VTRSTPSSVLRRLAVPALAVAAVAAIPSGASAATTCPSSGKTLAVSLSSDPTPVPIARVWRSGGKTYGCTTTAGIAPKTRLLTTRKTGLVRLDFDTVGWTAKVKRKGKSVTRVWSYDLANGKPWLSGVQPVPARADGDSREEGSVDQLRVGAGLMIAWVANGSTVVVGAKTPDTIELVEDGAAAPLYSDAGLAVAGSYEADAAARKSLRSSLKIAPVPGDHGDADDCAYGYLTAFTWKIGGPDALEARIAGIRDTPYTCP
jgi:hypothetical protein